MYCAHTRAHKQVLREREITGIISNKSNGSPTIFGNSNGVNFGWINQIVIMMVIGVSVKVTTTRPNQVEAITMKMHWMVLRIPYISPLEHYFHFFTVLYHPYLRPLAGQQIFVRRNPCVVKRNRRKSWKIIVERKRSRSGSIIIMTGVQVAAYIYT